MGAGKTFISVFEFIPRIIEKYEEKGKGGIIFMTAPDSSLAQQTLGEIKKWHKHYLQAGHADRIMIVDDINEMKHARQFVKNGLFVIVCVCVQSVASYVKFLNGKSSLVIAWIGDELHKGLALGKLDDEASDELCREHYKGYQGWTAPFRQKWFRSVLDLKADIMIGMTGTPSKFQKESDKSGEFYETIIDDVKSPIDILPFVKNTVHFDVFTDKHMDGKKFKKFIENFSLRVYEDRALLKYFIDVETRKYKNDVDDEKVQETLKTFGINSNVIGLLKICTGKIGLSRKKWIEYAVEISEKLSKKVKNKTFKIKNPLTNKIITLPYKDGMCGVESMYTGKKDISDKQKLDNLNNPDHNSGLLFVVNKGSVGLNMDNLKYYGAIRNTGQFKHDEWNEIHQEDDQSISRLNRTPTYLKAYCRYCLKNFPRKFAWILINIYLHMIGVEVYIPNGTRYYPIVVNEWKEKLPTYKELISYIESIDEEVLNKKKKIKTVKNPSGQAYDLGYQKFKKDRCESEGCGCYEQYVVNPHKSSEYYNLSIEERKRSYKVQILVVDHLFGKIEKIVGEIREEDLQTLCANEHNKKNSNE